MSVKIRSGSKVFGSAQEFKSAITRAIAKSTAYSKQRLLPWALRDTIPEGGIIPKKTGFMANTNFWHIHNSGSLGKLDINIHFDTIYSQFVEDKPSKTGSQYFMSRVEPTVKSIILSAILQAFQEEGILITSASLD